MSRELHMLEAPKQDLERFGRRRLGAAALAIGVFALLMIVAPQEPADAGAAMTASTSE